MSNNKKNRGRKRNKLYRGKVVRELVIKRAKGICQNCFVLTDPTDYTKPFPNKDTRILGPNYPTIDHIVPYAMSQNNSIDNFQLLCNDCNYNLGRLFQFYEIEKGMVSRVRVP